MSTRVRENFYALPALVLLLMEMLSSRKMEQRKGITLFLFPFVYFYSTKIASTLGKSLLRYGYTTDDVGPSEAKFHSGNDFSFVRGSRKYGRSFLFDHCVGRM